MGLGISLSQSSLSEGPQYPSHIQALVSSSWWEEGDVAIEQTWPWISESAAGALRQWCSLYLKVCLPLPHWAIAKIQRKNDMQGHREEAKVIAKIGILPSCLSLDCISPLLWLSNSEHTLLPILNILSSSKGRKPSPIELLHPVQSPRLMQHTPLSEIWIWLCVTSQHMNQWIYYLPSDPPVLLLLLLLNRFGCVRLCATPETAAHQAPSSLGFSRQEHWSGLPFPSPMQESEKWEGSCVRLFATPWTAAYQAPLSMGFSRQEYWSGFSTLTKPLQIQERTTTTDTSLQKKDHWRTHSNHWSAATTESDGTGIVRIFFAGSWGISWMRPDATCWWNFPFFCGPGSPFWRFFHVLYPLWPHHGGCYWFHNLLPASASFGARECFNLLKAF